MQTDNNLVAYDESSKPVWASNTVSWDGRDKILLTNRGEVKLREEVICMYPPKKQNTEVSPKDSVPPQTPKEASEEDIPEPSTTLPKEQNSEVPPKEEFEYRLLVRTLKELREDGEPGINANLPKEQNSEVPPKKDPKNNVLRAGESIYGYKMPGPYNTKYKTTMLEWTGTCGFDIKDIKSGKSRWLKLSTFPCNMIEMQADGNLMAYYKTHKNLVWLSKTRASPGNYLELTDDGEFYIKTKSGKVVGVL
ncbi:hypothetical protein KAU11_11520 [Candidatus Babeliales bacterium]|nr:hypothetical protein [Candidatus Babeliales bacterium]